MPCHVSRQSCHAVFETKHLMGIIGIMPDRQYFMIKYVRIRKLFNPKTVNIRILWRLQSSVIYTVSDRVYSQCFLSLFKGCCNLNELSIPDSVRKIGDNAFYRCASPHKPAVDCAGG